MNVGLESGGRLAALAGDRDWLARFGITRLGDLTGLDRIGIPVWFACRPNARSLCVAQGKGLTNERARISAVMESCEHHCAEHGELLDGIPGSWRDLAARGHVVPDMDRLAGCEAGKFDVARERIWRRGTSLRTGKEALAPFEAIGLDMRIDAPWDRAAFRMSTVGLGAGPTWEHACRHALREVIENDATLLHDYFGPLRGASKEIAHVSGCDGELDMALGVVREAGFIVRFARIPTDTRLPVVAASLRADASRSFGIDARAFAGYACRPSVAEAALAALLEAVQSRLTDISGARDDIDPDDFGRDLATPPRIGDSAALGDADESLGAPHPVGSLEDEVAACIVAGADDVLAFPLAPRDADIEVVRVLVPGFGHAPSEGDAGIGPRGIAALLGRFGAPS